MTLGEVLGILAEPIERILSLIPKGRLFESTHGGVAWVFGKPHKIEPGQIWWYLPAVTEIEKFPVCRQTLSCREQSILTKDNKSVAVKCVIVYEIKDIVKAATMTHDLDEAIEDLALCAAKQVLCSKTMEEIKEASDKIDEDLKKDLSQKVRGFGVQVRNIYVSDMVPCRVLRLMGAELLVTQGEE